MITAVIFVADVCFNCMQLSAFDDVVVWQLETERMHACSHMTAQGSRLLSDTEQGLRELEQTYCLLW